ncbi:MAG: TAXI family TRAP transporter solute-binding subunit [Alphaproteobacteria bacterium]|nr:TAXI family TRAP transporter solute-binding subunit [Alphaproteobacteria bacterium]
MFGRKISIGIVTLLAVTYSASLPAHAQEAIRIGTSSVGSVFYTLAIGASEVIQKHAKINATVEPVGGSTANMRGLAAKKIEFAIANSFASFTAYRGTYKFKKPVDVRMVVQGQGSYRWMVVRKAAKIRTVKDLIGRTIIAKRRALPEIELIMDALIKVHGLPRDKLNLVATTNTGQLVKALRAGSVDAAIMPFSRRSAQIAKPLNDGVIDFLYIPADKRDEMLKLLPPMMWPDTFKPGTFKPQKGTVNLIGLNTYFMTRADVSDDTVYKVAKALYENNKDFVSYHKAARQWNIKRALKNVALPFHPGVIRYFKEKKVWTAAHEANQTRLLKR